MAESIKKQDLEPLVINRNFAVYDPNFLKALKEIPWESWHRENRPFFCRDEYLERIKSWIESSTLNRITGLEHYSRRDLINGTTQTFDDAYFKYRNKRLRVFRGEYAYHRRVNGPLLFLEDSPLERGDYVIVSAPFCSTGDHHPGFFPILDQALALEVPVLVDCAYFGTCADFQLDLSHKAIESVSFSLTKGLGLGDIRSGIRFSRAMDPDAISQQNDSGHSVLAAARIGIYMMERFSADYIPGKYRDIQREVCSLLNIQPTKCMHLALGGEQWNHFRVDDAYNTLGIREAIRLVFKARQRAAKLAANHQ